MLLGRGHVVPRHRAARGGTAINSAGVAAGAQMHIVPTQDRELIAANDGGQRLGPGHNIVAAARGTTDGAIAQPTGLADLT